MSSEHTDTQAATGADLRRPTQVPVRCPLCGADDYTVRIEDTMGTRVADPRVHYTCTSSAFGEHGRIVECRSCHLVYMNPRPHHEAVVENYGEVEDQEYIEEEQGRLETFAESLELVRRYRPSGRLLDVGCHVGTFLTLAEAAGYEVAGVEPSRWGSEIARGRIGGHVHCGAVEDAPLPEGGYDVITLWDVIEHLPDPALDIRAIHAALRPGGIFAVSTMDVESLFARAAGRRWPWYMQRHLVYVSRRTLPEILRRAGCQICEVTTHVRRVRLTYLASRLDAYSSTAGRLVGRALERAGLAERTVGVSLGDIFTVIAKKPEDA
ncbi:MAG: class I SAM-dependent methyltransferase [Actinomycetota bacterium]